MPRLIASDSELRELVEEANKPTPAIGVLYPGIPYESFIDGDKPANDIDVARITGDWYTYLWGEVSYVDVFNEEHIMEFCGFRKGVTVGFLQCPFHNDPDHEKKAEKAN
jgi:hypothetical protein